MDFTLEDLNCFGKSIEVNILKSTNIFNKLVNEDWEKKLTEYFNLILNGSEEMVNLLVFNNLVYNVINSDIKAFNQIILNTLDN